MPTESAKFHLSLHVRDIQRSAEYYSRLLGVVPSKIFQDYAKFELDDPGLVLSLEQASGEQTQLLNHIGIRLKDKNALIDWTSKVAERGIDFQHLDNVACCYADQSKIYMNDPDGVLFEIYNVNKDLEPDATVRQSTVEPAQSGNTLSYDHVLPSDFPLSLTFADNSLETISLRGTFNALLDNERLFDIVKECQRVLKPGGEVVLHMLVSDKEPEGDPPTLPEPASYVKRIPSERLIWELMQEGGFVGMKAKRFSPHHVFQYKDSKFRELLLAAHKPLAPAKHSYTCIYNGPFSKVELESGKTFMRGVRTEVDSETFASIQSSHYENSFTILNTEGSSCG